MPQDRNKLVGGSDIRDQVRKGLSEVRTTVLGGQILLGFQYEALFQTRYEALSALRKALELAGFGLLMVTIVLMTSMKRFAASKASGE